MATLYQVIPGIVMAGPETTPAFYKVIVTSELEYSVRRPSPNPVSKSQPTVPHSNFHCEGMKPVDTRREILRCHETFKAILGIQVLVPHNKMSRFPGVDRHVSPLTSGMTRKL